jgi:uncharacterized protein (DUF1499 family)
MLRRPFIDVPMSQLATWSGRLGWFALAVAALSVLILRTDILDIGPALATFGAALVFAALAVLLAFAAFVVIWREGSRGLGRAVLGLALGLLLLAYPGYLGYRATRTPAINDITTDTANPPSFAVLGRLRPRGRIAYPGAQTAALQRAAFPDIEPLEYDIPVAVTYEAALSVIAKRGWYVVDSRPPAAGGRPGTIEAVARTLIMGFRDDVVVRVSPLGRGSRIDVRSASRYGTHDFGANARRVASLLQDIDEAVSSIPATELEKRPVPPAQPGRR